MRCLLCAAAVHACALSLFSLPKMERAILHLPSVPLLPQATAASTQRRHAKTVDRLTRGRDKLADPFEGGVVELVIMILASLFVGFLAMVAILYPVLRYGYGYGQ